VPAALDGDPKNWLVLRKDAGSGGRRYLPMLAVSSESLPVGEDWLFEPKWDGFRAIVTVTGGEVTFTSRNGNDLTGRFREVARAAAAAITTPDAVLDGEICALDDRGRSRFSLLQEGNGTPVLMLFDLLELDSDSLVDEPLHERRRRLEQIVDQGAGVLVSPQFDDGPALLAAAGEQELEGVVAMDDVIKLAITELLGGRQPHVRRRRIEVLSNLGVAVAFVAMAGGAVIGKVPGRLLQNLGRRGNRISALRGARRQRPGAQPPCQSGFHPAGSLSRATAMRNQAGNPESSPQQQNDNQSSPEHTRHEYLSDSVLVAPPSRRLSRGRLAHAGRANHSYSR
jgi:hypothetical protein